jgi:type VI secretion system secreted protein VgrG
VDETIRVGGAQHLDVAKGRALSIGADDDVTVRGNSSLELDGSRIEVIRGNNDERVSGQRTLRVEGNDRSEIVGRTEHHHLGEVLTRVHGNQTIVVGKSDAPRSFTLRVEGTATLSSEHGLELASSEGITLRCGSTAIRIGKDGIELTGAMVRAAGESGGLEAGKEGLKLTSQGVYAQLGDKLLVQTAEASIAMGSEVQVAGKKILLNSPTKATEEPPPEPRPPTEIALVDQNGRPLAGQRFVIELDDGSQRTGVTDKDGKATVELPQSGRIRFPDVASVKRA